MSHSFWCISIAFCFWKHYVWLSAIATLFSTFMVTNYPHLSFLCLLVLGFLLSTSTLKRLGRRWEKSLNAKPRAVALCGVLGWGLLAWGLKSDLGRSQPRNSLISQSYPRSKRPVPSEIVGYCLPFRPLEIWGLYYSFTTRGQKLAHEPCTTSRE